MVPQVLNKGPLDTAREYINAAIERAIDARAFGVVGDGATDDTSALQGAVDAAISEGAALFLGPGSIKVSGEIIFDGADGLTVFGAGSGFNANTKLQASSGMSEKSLLRLVNCRNCCFRDFSTSCNSSAPIKAAIEITNTNAATLGGSTVSTKNIFENLYLYSTSANTGQTDAILFSLGGNGDQNNDLCTFKDVVASNYDSSGCKIGHSQSREHKFIGCYFQSGLYAIDTLGLSFFWLGGNVSEHTDVDFKVRVPQQSSEILGLSSEQSAALLDLNSASAADGYVTIMATRFAADNLRESGHVIDYRCRGSLNLHGNIFGTRTDPNLCAVKIAPIGSKGCAFISQGNTWGGTGSLAVSPYQLSLSRADKIRIADNYVDSSTLVDTSDSFVDGDTSPSVFASDMFTTQNTGSTTITKFDDAWPGKVTHIEFNDANTTIDFTNTSKLRGNNGAAFTGAVGDSMTCVFDGSKHHCSIILG